MSLVKMILCGSYWLDLRIAYECFLAHAQVMASRHGMHDEKCIMMQVVAIKGLLYCI